CYGDHRVLHPFPTRRSSDLKREIMELYLNQIYFGSGAYGIEAAAEEYFGTSASQLDLAQSAMLAALPRAPSRLNPRADEEAALRSEEHTSELQSRENLVCRL